MWCRPLFPAEPIRVGFIDPLSGPFANVGEMEVRAFSYSFDQINARGGVLGGKKFELVQYDNKANAQEAVLALKHAIDDGVRFILQGNSSSVALALTDAIAKHNQRDPERTVLFLNYAAILPELTNEKCNFWHFRFEADGDIKMTALGSAIAENKSVKKVYLINQDYSSGQVYAKSAREMLVKKRSDIQIVGDELHPLGKVKDFAPYVAKIRASGADTVLTNNWGNDLTLLLKAAKETGLQVDFYTYYANSPGVLSILGDSAIGRVKLIGAYDANGGDDRGQAYFGTYRQKYGEDYLVMTQVPAVEMLALAIDNAQSADPLKVAIALEGLNWDGFFGAVHMRKDNHQLIQPMFLASATKVDGKQVTRDWDRSGIGWKVDHRTDGKDTLLPTACKMDRP
jgi:branched-chain amino acid transport system substrate-binding protein